STETGKGQRLEVTLEQESENGEVDVELTSRSGVIHADLRVGADVASVTPLRATERIAGMGVALHGSGFILDPETAAQIGEHGAPMLNAYLGGRDALQERRERYLIDFSGMTQEEARLANPAAFQHVIDYVKPGRDHNNRKALKDLWWRFGWERPVLRDALSG